MNSNALVTAKVISQMISVPASTIYDWAREKKIPHVKLSDRVIRFEPDRVMAWWVKKRLG